MLVRRLQQRRRRIKSRVQAYVRYLLLKTKYKNPGRPGKELLIEIDKIKWTINDRYLSRQSPEYKRIYRSVNSVIEGSFWNYLEPVVVRGVGLEGFFERFVLGWEWSETSLFKKYKEMLEEGNKVQGLREMEKVIDLYEKRHDVLYQKLQRDGFKSARDNPEISPIYVYIYSDGSFVYTSGGNHRLNMARLLGIEKIPVLIQGRHIEWQARREDLARMGTAAFLQKYPAFAGHPDLFF